MVLPESKNRVGLGRALMKSRGINTSRGRRGRGRGDRRERSDGSVRYTTEIHREFGSITEQAALDEFLATAQLADTDFTAEKMNIRIIHPDQKNPYLLSADEETSVLRIHNAHINQLTVPRRPKWDSSTTPTELDCLERDSFLQWRRGLAELQENLDLLMTPFERNLEMWRQLWRVIERSDLVVQIVDARNPLMFRSEDLERYVKEVDPRKKTLLLINKADMMTEKQRLVWAEYFEQEGIAYTFFSAALAQQQNELKLSDDDEAEEFDGVEDDITEEEFEEAVKSLSLKGGEVHFQDEDKEGGCAKVPKVARDDATTAEALGVSKDEGKQEKIRIISADELERLFLEEAPEIERQESVMTARDGTSSSADSSEGNIRKTIIGLVGYPNVGKSSTINALIRSKKVSVSTTPGKTKHFQTIHLSPSVVLCDCPGLVFPNFASTKAELVCNGILPIDQLREHTGPAALVAQRIPQHWIEALYGIKITTRPPEEGGAGTPTAEELLRAYARARGFTKTGTAEPDESRAARVILKDYVNGKLLWCKPPPATPPIGPSEFNVELYEKGRAPTRRQSGLHSLSTVIPDIIPVMSSIPREFGEKSISLDKQFFSRESSSAGHLKSPFHRPAITNGKPLSGRKAKQIYALDNNLSLEEAHRLFSGKKHFKGNKKK